MKKCNGLLLMVMISGTIVAIGAESILNQKRSGTSLIVTYADGRVVTNSLFLAMAPEVKNEVAKIETDAMMKATLAAVIEDTRRNIRRTTDMSDSQIALLYLAQMSKPADQLAAIAPTNTVEFLIGAGMRQDVEKLNEVKNEQF